MTPTPSAQVIEAMAVAISGAPFASDKSRNKAERAIKAASEAGWVLVNRDHLEFATLTLEAEGYRGPEILSTIEHLRERSRG